MRLLVLTVVVIGLGLVTACAEPEPPATPTPQPASTRTPTLAPTPAPTADTPLPPSTPTPRSTAPRTPAPTPTATSTLEPTLSTEEDAHAERGDFRPDERESCSGGRINFDHAPFDLDRITFIRPLGAVSGSHVTPTDHQYWRAAENEIVEVYSPGEGFITLIERMGTVEEQREDWRIRIEHSCTIASLYIHIDKLASKLAVQEPITRRTSSVRIPVEAGEVIGWYDFSVDYNVVDQDITIGLLTPRYYEGEPWKIHTQDPFLYFNEPLKSQLEALSLRTDPPLGGRIDYDVDGKMIGNWFEDGTEYRTDEPRGYWTTHLSIAPDYIDPDFIIVSIGDFAGEARQFGVRGNAPDPAQVGIGTLVKYELIDFQYKTGDEFWDRQSLVKGLRGVEAIDMHGVILLELIEDRTLKVEVFPGKSGSEVSGFTSGSKIYRR